MGVRPVRVERQLAHLLERRLPDLLAEAVAEVDREQAGERVEVALPVRILEVAAVPPNDDRHLGFPVAAHAREVQPEVVAGGLLEVERGHACPFLRWSRTLASIAATATTKITVLITFTCGGAPMRAAPQTKTGNVTS